MNFREIFVVSLVGIAICCLGPYLVSLIVALTFAIPLWLTGQLGGWGWWLLSVPILLTVLAWRRYKRREL